MYVGLKVSTSLTVSADSNIVLYDAFANTLQYIMMNSLQKPYDLKPILFENFQGLNRDFSCHHHSTYSVGITHKGLFLSCYGNQTHPVYRGGTRVLNPEEAHGGNAQEWSLTNFYPTVELMGQIYKEVFCTDGQPLFESHVIEDRHLYILLRRFFLCVYYKEDALETESAMLEALSYLVLHYAQTQVRVKYPDGKELIAHSIELIHDSVKKGIALSSLAREAGISKYHFLRIFKKYTGLTPHQYALSVRIQQATQKIIAGESIAEASLEYGFSDQSHFTRHFKRIYGYTPHKISQNSNIVLYR